MERSARAISEVEEMLSLRMRQRHASVDRVSIQGDLGGWTAYRVWLKKSSREPSRDRIEGLLAEANFILGHLQKQFEIVER